MLIGTLQYMAPEQLEGADADARTDIFALGVLLHEMVTGKKTFEGKSRVLLMSAIATSEPPPLSSVEPATPPALEHVVRTCMAKEPVDRWQTARDLLAELQAIAAGADDGFVAASASSARRKSRLLPRLLAATVLVAGMILSVPAYLHLRGEAAPGEVRLRIPIQLSADPAIVNLGGTTAGNGGLFRPEAFAVSPDGRWVAMSVRNTGSDPWLLYVRPLGGVAPQRFPGTEDAAQSFWSADSKSIAFVSSGKLKRVEVAGGPPSGSVSGDGLLRRFVEQRRARSCSGRQKDSSRSPEQGGTPELITTLDASESGHYWPHFLPDGQHYLYTAWGQPRGARRSTSGRWDRRRRSNSWRSSRTGHT